MSHAQTPSRVLDHAVGVPPLVQWPVSYWAYREEVQWADPAPTAPRPLPRGAAQHPTNPARVSLDEADATHAAPLAIHSARVGSSHAAVHAWHNRMDS